MDADDETFEHMLSQQDVRQEVLSSLRELKRIVGSESADGKGGTGLFGEVRRMSSNVDALMLERNLLRGALAAVIASTFLLVAGVKYWITTIVGTMK